MKAEWRNGGNNMTNKTIFEQFEKEQKQGELDTINVEKSPALSDEKQKKITDSADGVSNKESFDYKTGDLPSEEALKVAFLEDEDIEIIVEEVDGVKAQIKKLKRPLIISTARVLKPKTKDSEGNLIEPMMVKSIDHKGQEKITKYYESKLEITYANEPYKSLVPNIKWFVNIDTLNPSFLTEYSEKMDMKYVSEITKLYWKFCDAFGFDKTKKNMSKVLSQKAFVDGLVGKKVKIKETSGVYKKTDWSKISIVSFEEE